MLFLLVSGTSSSHTRRAGSFVSQWLYDEVRDRGAVLKNTNSLFMAPGHTHRIQALAGSIVSWLCCSIVPSASVRSERSSSLDDADDDHTAPTQASRRCSRRAPPVLQSGHLDTGTQTRTWRRNRNRNRKGDRKGDPPTEPGPEENPRNDRPPSPARAPPHTCPRN